MKNMFESKEVFFAYVQIDCAIWSLKELSNKLKINLVPIDIVINEATGFVKEENKQAVKEAKGLLNIIIENKKLIECEYDHEIEALKRIEALEEKFKCN